MLNTLAELKTVLVPEEKLERSYQRDALNFQLVEHRIYNMLVAAHIPTKVYLAQ